MYCHILRVLAIPTLESTDSMIIMLVLNFMGTTSNPLSGYGNHFTDVLLKLDSNGIQSIHYQHLCYISSLLLYKHLLVSLFLLQRTEIYNADGEHVATMHFTSYGLMPQCVVFK